MYSKLASDLDRIASSLEKKGLKKEAEELDVIANTMQAMDIEKKLRKKLTEEGFLGLDTIGEAKAEILNDKNWKKRWDVDEELAELGDAYRKSEGLLTV